MSFDATNNDRSQSEERIAIRLSRVETDGTIYVHKNGNNNARPYVRWSISAVVVCHSYRVES